MHACMQADVLIREWGTAIRVVRDGSKEASAGAVFCAALPHVFVLVPGR